MVAGEGNDANHYVGGGVVTAKTANTATINKTDIDADGVDEAIISNLYNPSDVRLIPGGTETVTDGVLEVTADSACTIEVLCRAVPHLDKEFTINAT